MEEDFRDYLVDGALIVIVRLLVVVAGHVWHSQVTILPFDQN